MFKLCFLRVLTVLTLIGAFGVWSSAQTSKAAPKQNPNPAVSADENATEQRSGIKDTVDIVEGPKVENVTKSSAVLEWKTNKRAATRVQYGTDQSHLTQRAFEPGGAREHRVQLKNLKPGTNYFYAIETRGGKQRYDGQFQTPAK
jgi:phosphodiesterase/alkaline phosphatase D-like protein